MAGDYGVRVVVECPCCGESLRVSTFVKPVKARRTYHERGMCDRCMEPLHEKRDRRPDGEWRWYCLACRAKVARAKHAKSAGETSHSAGVRDPHRDKIAGKTETDCAGNATRPLTANPLFTQRGRTAESYSNRELHGDHP